VRHYQLPLGQSPPVAQCPSTAAPALSRNMNPSPPIFTIPTAAAIDTSSDRALHESIKAWEGYEAMGLPAKTFWKRSKIGSPDFVRDNPLIAKLRHQRRIIAYGYQRANRAKDAAPLVQKRFGLQADTAAALEAAAADQGLPQVEIVERAIAAYLEMSTPPRSRPGGG
jgi:hypothetical protein